MFSDSTTINRRIRFALVGCGRIAQCHFEALNQYADMVELVGVCDVDAAALTDAVKKTGAQPYKNLENLLLDANADVIILATPSGLHASQAIQTAATNRHVVTEKPMATTWNDGIRMIRACEQAGVHLFVVKQNRYNSTLQLLRRAVVQNRFGRIYTVQVNVFWQRPQSYYDSAAWRGTLSLDGGAFMNQASHYVDLLHWLIGPVESVHAYTATLARQVEVEDTGILSIKWRSGTLGSMNVTMLTYPKNLEGSITIIGEKGTVRVGGVAVNEIQHWYFMEPHEEDEQVKQSNYQPESVYGSGHTLFYDNVIQTLRGQAKPAVDGLEGLKSLEILVAAYQSASGGKVVHLPLESQLSMDVL